MRTLRPTRAGRRYVDRPPLLAVLRAFLAPPARRLLGVLAQRGTLSIVGLGLLVAAAWQHGTFVGLLAAGAALLIIDGRIIT